MNTSGQLLLPGRALRAFQPDLGKLEGVKEVILEQDAQRLVGQSIGLDQLIARTCLHQERLERTKS